MQLLTYKDMSGRYRAGVKIGERVFDAQALTGREECATILSMLEDWERIEPLLADLDSDRIPANVAPVEPASLGTPVRYPGAIYCACANYRDHMHAMAVKLGQPDEPDPRELNIKPYHFVVPGRTCAASADDPVRLPPQGKLIDWEIELVAVIGKPARQVSVEQALDHVAFYTLGNDVSIRDRHFIVIPNVSPNSQFRTDFIGMKGFDQSKVIGPLLTLARDVPDPQALAMKLWLDGEVMQDSSTSQMIFGVAEQISYLSSRTTLLPGDMVMTGTPAGVGMERDRFLEPGETIRMFIENIGETTLRVAA